MKLSTGFEKKKARIEVIPLIDIMFLLLVFFIYAMLSMTILRGLKVDLPHTQIGSISQKECLAITINQENEIFLNKEKVDLQALPYKIQESRRSRPDQRIFINGDEKARLGITIEVLDVLRAYGVEEVNFVTKKRQ